MTEKLFFLSAYRRYFISIIIFILVGIFTFIFTEKAQEYYYSTIEINEASKFYRAIGEIVWNEDQDVNIRDISEYLEGSEYVKTVNYHGAYSGVLVNVGNNVGYQLSTPNEQDVIGYSSAHDVIFVGTYTGKITERKDCAYFFAVDEVLSGYEEYVFTGKKVALYYSDRGLLGSSLEVGRKYVIRGHYSYILDNSAINMMIQPEYAGKVPVFSIFELKSICEDGPLFIKYENAAEYEKQIGNDILLMDENRRSIYVEAYSDISAMSELQGAKHELYLEEGYWPSIEDDKNLCVISKQLASSRAISVGDSIEISLRDVMPAYGEGYIDINSCSEYEKISKEKMELKVAGIFAENSEMAYRYDTIYAFIDIVPKNFQVSPTLPIYMQGTVSALNDGVTLEVVSSETSIARMAGTFVLNSNDEIDEFYETSKEYFDSKNASVIFYENGYESFKKTSDKILNDDRTNLRIYGAILLFLYIVSVELYSISLRKEVGLFRVFGISKKKCVESFMFPISVLGIVSIMIGSAAAYVRTMNNKKVFDFRTSIFSCMLFLILIFLLLIIIFAYACFSVNVPLISAFKKTYHRKIQKKIVGKTKAIDGSSKKNHYILKFAYVNHMRSFDGWIWISIIMCLCIVCNSFLSSVIKSQKNRLENLYESITIQVDIAKVDNYFSSIDDERGFISQRNIDILEKLGYYEQFHLSSELPVIDIYEISESTGYIENEHKELKTPIEASTDFDDMLVNDKVANIEWKDDWNRERFDNPKIEEYPILVPDFYFNKLWSKDTTHVAIYYEKGEKRVINTFVIAGTYSEGVGHIYSSIFTLKKLMGDELLYYFASSEVKNEFNTRIDLVKTESDYVFDNQELAKIIFWDEEFTGSVNHVKAVIEVLEILSVIMEYATIILICVLAMLITYLRRRDGILIIAIGNSIYVGRLIVLIQLWLTEVYGILGGLIISLILSGLYNKGFSIEEVDNIVLRSVVYIFVTMIIGIIVSVAIINKREIKILKVKE